MRTAFCVSRSLSLVVALCAALSAPAGATLIGGPGPLPGLDPDNGTELFTPNLNPIHSQHVVLVKEMFDPVPTAIPHEWGIYFKTDPSTLIPVFTTADSGSGQRAVLSFDSGLIVDLDALTIENNFGASLGEFGFYLNLHPTGGPDILRYSQPSLNPGGVDATATFPFQANPTYYFVGFEINDLVFSLEIVDGVNPVPVPEPGVVVLLGGGLALFAVAPRMRRAA